MATATSTPTAVQTFNVTNKPEAREMIARIVELKQIERDGAAAERERKELEATLRGEMGDAMQIVLRGNVIAKLSSERTTHIYDYELLRTAWPEAFQAVHSERKYRFLQVL